MKRDGTGRITHSIIFEIIHANDIFENFWEGKVAHKTLRYEALQIVSEQATRAPCYLSTFVLGICGSFGNEMDE